MEPLAAARGALSYPRFLAKCHFPRVSCQSSMLVNDKGDNEIIVEATLRFPGVYLMGEVTQPSSDDLLAEVFWGFSQP